LNEATNVPVDASFEIEFTEAMDPSSVDAVHLQVDGLEISFDGSWLTSQILIITPIHQLSHGVRYTLTVDETARDINDNLIDLSGESHAAFDTV
jgi:hypothetical protein